MGVCCLLNQTVQWYTRKILSVFWPHETKQINRKKTRNRIKHGEAMIAQLMITLLSNRIEEECGSAWKVLSSWIKYNSLVENMMSEVLNHLFSRYVIATCPQRSQVLWRRLLSVWSSQWLTEHACVRTMRSPQNSVSPLQTSRGKCRAHYIHDFSPPGKTTSNQPIYPTHTHKSFSKSFWQKQNTKSMIQDKTSEKPSERSILFHLIQFRVFMVDRNFLTQPVMFPTVMDFRLSLCFDFG